MLKFIERDTTNGTSNSFYFDSVLHHSRVKRLEKNTVRVTWRYLDREYINMTILNVPLFLFYAFFASIYILTLCLIYVKFIIMFYYTFSLYSSSLTLTSFDTPDSCIVIPYRISANSIVFFLCVINMNWEFFWSLFTYSPKLSTFTSSSAASTSSSTQNGTGLVLSIANNKDIAVKVFSSQMKIKSLYFYLINLHLKQLFLKNLLFFYLNS